MRFGAQQTTVLFGAGVGVPAGLPTAKELIEDIAYSLVVDRRWADEVVGRVQPDGPLRFETAMDWITETSDEDLAVFAFLDDVEPGPLHQALALQGLRGVQLVTVNFDDLVEAAIADAGGMPVTVDAHVRSPVVEPGVEVLKLHGTRRQHIGRSVVDGAMPLHATISSIVKGGGGGDGLANPVHDVLASAVNGRSLIIIGYSGSDDLDVMPSLRRCQPSHVVWFAHSDGEPRLGASTEAGQVAVVSLLDQWRAGGADVEVVVGETTACLRSLGWDVPPPLPDELISAVRERRKRSIAKWADAAHKEDLNGNAWVSHVLGTLGFRQLSHEAMLASVASESADGLWSEQRRLYELAQSTYLLPDTVEFAEVIRLARASAKLALARDDGRTAGNAEVMIARALMFDDDFAGAEAALDRAAEALEEDAKRHRRGAHARAYLALWRARLHLRRGDGKAATATAEDAASQYAGVGDWSAECESVQVAAQGHWVEDEFDLAIETLQKAIDIARTAPFPDQLEAALNRLSMIAYAAGDVELAEKAGKEGAAIVLEFGMFAESAQTFSSWGTAANELELYHDAEEAFRLARTHLDAASRSWRRDITFGFADTLVHLGRFEEARSVLDDVDAVAPDVWDRAHGAALRRVLGDVSAEDVDAAIAHANAANADPEGRPVMCILRLGRTGRAFDELATYALDVLDHPGHQPRRNRLASWLRA